MDITFTDTCLSTITVEARFSNLNIKESELTVACTPDQYVVKIESNFGEKTYEHYTPPVPKPRSNRGRRKSVKPKRKARQVPGTGKYMNSQTTFNVISRSVPNKMYKIKVFRTGTIQIPGAIHSDLDDVQYAIDKVRDVISRAMIKREHEQILAQYLDCCLNTEQVSSIYTTASLSNEEEYKKNILDIIAPCNDEQKNALCTALIARAYKQDTIKLIQFADGYNIKIIMKNSKWCIANSNYMFDLQKFKLKLLEVYNDKSAPIQFINQSIKYDADRYQGLIFKARMRVTEPANEVAPHLLLYSSFKIFRSGKVNVTNQTRLPIVEPIKAWLIEFIRSYANTPDKFIHKKITPTTSASTSATTSVTTSASTLDAQMALMSLS